jgi:hypothetical protein
MNDLSPAAAKAFNAAWAETGIILDDHEGTLRNQIAASLRALADHRRQLRCTLDGPLDHWDPDQRTRQELRNIADELEREP